MAKQFSRDDVFLLGYDSVCTKYDGDAFAAYDAEVKAGADHVVHRFIYLKYRCTQASAIRAVPYLRDSDGVAKSFVIKPSSLNSIQVSEIFEKEGYRIQSHEELVWMQLKDIFSSYINSLSSAIPPEENFMEPRLKENEQEQGHLINRLMDYMRGRNSSDNGYIKILSAHAGVGKTTLSRYLVRELAGNLGERTKIIPIFVEAHHWGRLDLSEIESLWSVIKNSLEIIDESERSSRHLSESLFRHALRQGYLSFVFDGFDELCGNEAFDADAILKELTDIASQSEARVVLTTRTLFWDAQISSAPDNASVWILDSFNSQQAKGYFRKVFGQSTNKYQIADQLYSTLLKESQTPPQHTGSVRDRFVNLPLCVRMIADLVRDENIEVKIETDKKVSILQRILVAFCEREQRRIHISTDPLGQLASLRDRALESNELNPRFDVEDLIYTVNGFSENDLPRLDRHGLIDVEHETKKYRFRYDFLGPHLRAVAVAEWLVSSEIPDLAKQRDIVKIIMNEANGQGLVLEQLGMLLGLDDFPAVITKGRLLCNNGAIASFVFHLAQTLLDGIHALTNQEKTRRLFSGMSGVSQSDWSGVLMDWEFRGTIEGLDFRGMCFMNCEFENVMFRRCVADENTKFQNCDFRGELQFEGNIRSWKNILLDDRCRVSPQAGFEFQYVLQKQAIDRTQHIGEILKIGLEKFWYSGHIKLKLKKNDWNKGILSRSGQANRLLDAMIKVKLVNIDFRERIVFDRDSRSDLQNFMDNGRMSGKILMVYRYLVGQE